MSIDSKIKEYDTSRNRRWGLPFVGRSDESDESSDETDSDNISLTESSLMGSVKSKKKEKEKENIFKETQDVSETETHDKKLGMIHCDLALKNSDERIPNGVSGTLIHERIVLTCAHFLFHKKCWKYKTAMDVYLEPNQSMGFELWIEDIEHRYIVKNMSESSPFKSQGLQNGDCVTKLLKWNDVTKKWEKHPLSLFRHGLTLQENAIWKLEGYRIKV